MRSGGGEGSRWGVGLGQGGWLTKPMSSVIAAEKHCLTGDPSSNALMQGCHPMDYPIQPLH